MRKTGRNQFFIDLIIVTCCDVTGIAAIQGVFQTAHMSRKNELRGSGTFSTMDEYIYALYGI